MINLPPIYPLTDSRRAESLSEQVKAFGEAGFPLVQFRGKPLEARVQYEELLTALQTSFDNGGWPLICVNDRADLAVLAVQGGLEPWGLHLGQTDLPPAEARRLPYLERVHIGTSTHDESEWSQVNAACDHAGVGPYRATATKSDHAAPIGLEGLRRGCVALRAKDIAPIAIGGIGRADFEGVFAAGAASIALISEWDRHDPRDLAWTAQGARWKAQPPFRKGQGIALTGGSGVGKSALAAALGPCLGSPVLDLDALIEARAGLGIPQIFEAQGEAAFRQLETEVLKACLGAPSVLALGGGAWESPGTRSALSSAGFAVLWLAEPPGVAWSRVAGDSNRPLAQDRNIFMARHRLRLQNWCGLPMILPCGRRAEEIAECLADTVD